MTARELRQQTLVEQAEWERAVRAFAIRVGQVRGTDQDAARVAAQLDVILRSQGRAAVKHGVATVGRLVDAAGIAPDPPTDFSTVQMSAAVQVSADLNRQIRRAWRRAERSSDPQRLREATLRLIVDGSLSSAWRAGMDAALQAQPAVTGWRRVSNPGSCGACLALTDGAIHETGTLLPTHTHCRCIQEPVVVGVNQTARSETPADRFGALSETEQTTMFRGHGGDTKAELLRRGLIAPKDLVGYATNTRRTVIYERPLREFAAQVAAL